MKLTLGFSPCPNDTFIFDAMVNGKIDTHGLSFEVVLEDVETLNKFAGDQKLDITKLSYSSFLQNLVEYALLHSGSALGKGVGPLLVCRKSELEKWNDRDLRSAAKIAIPGRNTTANLLLSLAFPEIANKQEIIFSEIEQAVLSGAFDMGLIIHESRFTYEQKGLVKVLDLGDWWENKTNALIPLGCIAIKRDIDKEIAKKVDSIIKESIQYAWGNYPALSDFVKEHAQEMQEDVMRKHIELYVNNYTKDLGDEGRRAVTRLFEEAKKIGLIKEELPQSIFY